MIPGPLTKSFVTSGCPDHAGNRASASGPVVTVQVAVYDLKISNPSTSKLCTRINVDTPGLF